MWPHVAASPNRFSHYGFEIIGTIFTFVRKLIDRTLHMCMYTSTCMYKYVVALWNEKVKKMSQKYAHSAGSDDIAASDELRNRWFWKQDLRLRGGGRSNGGCSNGSGSGHHRLDSYGGDINRCLFLLPTGRHRPINGKRRSIRHRAFATQTDLVTRSSFG